MFAKSSVARGVAYAVFDAAQVNLTLLHTDLDNGPNTGGENGNGVYVTLYGYGFGASRGVGTVELNGVEVADYKVWSNTKIAVQLGGSTSSGDFTVTTNDGYSVTGCQRRQFGRSTDFTVRSGSIVYVSTSGSGSTGSFASPVAYNSSLVTGAGGGTIVVFRSGTYTGSAGDGWGDANYNLGPSNSGTTTAWTTFVGYPGETVEVSGHDQAFYLQNSSTNNPHFLTIANFTLSAGYNCVRGGHYPPSFTQGSHDVRLIGCNFVRPGLNWNSQTGSVALGGDNWSVLSNTFRDTGTGTPINQNHALYVQCHPTNVDVGWNLFTNLRMGYVVQNHTDNDTGNWVNVNIFGNIIEVGSGGQCRGYTASTVGSGSTINFYNNIAAGIGDTVSALNLEGSATYEVIGNTFYNIDASANGLITFGYAVSTCTIKNNIFWAADASTDWVWYHSGASSANKTWENNVFYNGPGTGLPSDASLLTSNPLFVAPANVSGDFTLQSGSPCINSGASVSGIAAVDRNGITRTSPDRGCHEYTS